MLDPFPIPPPPFLVSAIKPYADYLNLHSLPLHIHEVLFAACLYTLTCNYLSPFLCIRLFPGTCGRFSRRSRLKWDVHVVSFVQACVINGLSLYIIWCDEERKAWRPREMWKERIWGYYGSGGLCQSFALGYFLWDLCMCCLHIDIFGWGMLAHAVCAVSVFGIGYRPFIYFSAPIFLLYELSSPFLNIHWFCDKLHLTGSLFQAINGILLVVTFFSCRLCWGIYNSFWVFRDMYWAYQTGHTNYNASLALGSEKLHVMTTADLLAVASDQHGQATAFNREQYTPLWIPLTYLLSNLVLNSLNIFWFGKMIETIRTRSDPPLGTKGLAPEQKPSEASEDSDLGVGEPGKDHHHHDNEDEGKGKGSVKAARERAEAQLERPVGTVGDTKVERAAYEDGHTGVEVTGSQRKGGGRSRRKA